MDYLRTILNIPVPKVLAYSTDAGSTPVGAEFIIMEKIRGTVMSTRIEAVDRWPQVPEIHPLADEIMTHEGKFLEARFAAFGSIYYKEDVSLALQNKPLYHVRPIFKYRAHHTIDSFPLPALLQGEGRVRAFSYRS